MSCSGPVGTARMTSIGGSKPCQLKLPASSIGWLGVLVLGGGFRRLLTAKRCGSRARRFGCGAREALSVGAWPCGCALSLNLSCPRARCPNPWLNGFSVREPRRDEFLPLLILLLLVRPSELQLVCRSRTVESASPNTFAPRSRGVISRGSTDSCCWSNVGPISSMGSLPRELLLCPLHRVLLIGESRPEADEQRSSDEILRTGSELGLPCWLSMSKESLDSLLRKGPELRRGGPRDDARDELPSFFISESLDLSRMTAGRFVSVDPPDCLASELTTGRPARTSLTARTISNVTVSRAASSSLVMAVPWYASSSCRTSGIVDAVAALLSGVPFLARFRWCRSFVVTEGMTNSGSVIPALPAKKPW